MSCSAFFHALNVRLEKISNWIAAHPIVVLHLLILLGLGIRFIRWGIEDFQPRDTSFYFANAEIIAKQGWAAFYQTGVEAYKNLPPGFFLLLQAGAALGLSLPTSGFIILLISYLLLVYSIYFGINVLWNDRRYALLGVLFAVTTPWLLRLGIFILRDAPYFAFGAAALTAGAYAVIREQYRYWVLFAFFAFCAIMLRKEGFELLMGLGCWCVFSFFVQLFRKRWRSAFFALGSGLLVTLLTLLPLLVLEHHFRTSFGSTWEVIPTTWSGYIWSMFKSLVNS